MARQPATRLQLSGQRLLARRMMHALVRRDVSMFDDPIRAQSISLAIGGLVATLVVLAGTVLGLVRGHGAAGSDPILIARDSGALYVRVDDILHPVLNLASARLIARSATNPAPASETAISEVRRGPLMGIPGAPAVIGAPLRGQPWTVCDDDRTVVAVGPSGADHLDSTRPVLVTPRGEGAAVTYLLYDGQRAAVDLRNVAVLRALGLNGVEPVQVSRTLLDVVPEVPAITAPAIPGAGGPGPAALGGAPIGAVVSVQGADAVERYVVLQDGLQVVGEVAADLIGFAYDDRGAPPVRIAPAAIAALPIAEELPVGTFPRRAGTPVGAADGYAVCVAWRPGAPSRTSSNSVVMVGDSPFWNEPRLTTLAQADGPGPDVDAVVIPGGASADVRSARIVGDDGASGARFLINDAGVVFGVHDDDAATFLGLTGIPDAAPWPILVNLPHGPELSVESASVVRDGLPAPS